VLNRFAFNIYRIDFESKSQDSIARYVLVAGGGMGVLPGTRKSLSKQLTEESRRSSFRRAWPSTDSSTQTRRRRSTSISFRARYRFNSCTPLASRQSSTRTVCLRRSTVTRPKRQGDGMPKIGHPKGKMKISSSPSCASMSPLATRKSLTWLHDRSASVLARPKASPQVDQCCLRRLDKLQGKYHLG
jgi:hypothetical protein